MAKRYRVTLTAEERASLERLIGHGKAAARQLTHARLLLTADEGEAGPGWTDERIAEALEIGAATVARVRERFVSEGLAVALVPKPTGRAYARKLDGEGEARLVALACSAPPEGRRRWTLRLLADRLVVPGHAPALSYETVRRALKKRAQALAEAGVVHPARSGRGVRRGDGGRAGGLHAPRRAEAAVGLPR
jgi:transposase